MKLTVIATSVAAMLAWWDAALNGGLYTRVISHMLASMRMHIGV